MDKEKYGATDGTKKAIMKAMNSISLRIFDVPGVKRIDFKSMLSSGKVFLYTYIICALSFL